MNHVTIFKWSSSFSYEVIVRNKVMYTFSSSKDRQFKSFISHLKHDMISKTLSPIYAIIGMEHLYRVEIDLVNLE